MIYNPWFERQGIDAVVVPMGVREADFPAAVATLRRLTNLRGALITMPHKVTVLGLIDEVTPTARIAGACNAVLLRPDGSLLGDQFDGAGFVRGVQRKGLTLAGKRDPRQNGTITLEQIDARLQELGTAVSAIQQ